jgi:uncharacterized protein (DUF2147 family)
MKKFIAAAAALILTAAVCFAADPVEGYWISYDEKTNKPTAGWRIYAENGILYGKILSLYGMSQDELAFKCKESYKGYPVQGLKVNQQKVVGAFWIFGLKNTKAGEWSGGNVIDPDNGSMYNCKITFRAADGKKFTADTLEMRGEIGLGIGRSQFWKTVTQEEAEGLR